MTTRFRALLLTGCCLALLQSTVAETVLTGAAFAALLEEARSPASVEAILRWRRHLHTIPELFFEEFNTSAYVRQQLDELGIPYTYPLGITGIRAGPIGAAEGPVIALRADMDGLPITEELDLPYKSTTRGRMHACGHDGHMAMLLGAARLLKAREASLPGRVVLLFQPAEEGLGGARRLIAEGALEGVEAIHGVHVMPSMPAGTIGTRPSTIMAASDRFAVTVRGLGGHGALPHTTRDPVLAASAVVMALQAIVSRETSPIDSAVVTVSRINTGPGAANVIPESVELVGTIRALTAPTFERLHTRLEQVAAGVAAAYGCTAENVTWSAVPYPPTQNEAAMAALVLDVASGLLQGGQGGEGDEGQGGAGPGRAVVVEPMMAAEDFSFYGPAVKQAAFTFLGTGDPALGTDAGLHTPRFALDETQLPLGAALQAGVALEWLQRRAGGQAGAEAGGAEAEAGARDEL
ncbi:hypothetical protein HYH03_018188 [Edaphochlamys debaryana]|uniref:Peptidase M20 dimerisation domain-containing protein n=1 Tax=Edaphochlamys debaryana TaxID=47281 RepID=A0A836BN62_9CHLO|nr:hypothetical protein HYH03_018188 [Edaphochlamys debaryana]|eukprot:KAG2482906.1 hypothetical protein HYH03_018188 [Edaphochlamys debaryana]